MPSDVKVNLKPLQRLRNRVDVALRGGGASHISDAFVQWAAIYRGFVQERFSKQSRGGGDWPSLKPATIKARRQGRSKLRAGEVRAAILVDTGIMKNVLDPTFNSKPGALEERIPFGVRVGYGGPGRYPGGSATIADIASFHQEGKGRLPKREIIVDPDSKTVSLMVGAMERALGKAYG